MARLLAACLLLIATASLAAAQELPIGQVKTATGAVTVIRAGRQVPLGVGSPVYRGDTIETGTNSSVGITFIDNSVFSTGPDSRLALDQFHFDSSNYQGDMLARLQKGTLSVVSGDIAHSSPGKMKIETPTAILGVRGTTFAVQVH